MIPTIDQEIIEKLKSGLSPAEISIQYEGEGKDIPAGYIRHIKMLVNAGMTEMLETEEDIPYPTLVNSVAKNSREYAQRHGGTV